MKNLLNKIKNKHREHKEKFVSTKFYKKIEKPLQFFKGLFKQQPLKHEISLYLSLIIHAVLAIVIELIIEMCSRHSISAGLTYASEHTIVFAYDCLLIFVTSLIAYICPKRRLVTVLVFGVWLALGISNGVILANRVTPLTGPDFKNIVEAWAVAPKYLPGFALPFVIILVIICIIAFIIFIFRSPAYKMSLKSFIISVVIVALSFGGLLGVTNYLTDQGILSSYFSNIAFAYQDYGFPYCFSVTLLDTGVSKPDNYKQSTITSILQEDGYDNGEIPDTLPNVIVVQLESFFDPTRVNYMELSEDPIPNFHALQEEYTSGFYTVPTIGAGTANTEFETLTGLSLRFFGPGEYPYKSVLKERACESSAFDLKDLGYTTFALHDNEANFYSRKVVYKNLGFDYFISGEYMLNQDDTNYNGWMRDENLIEPIVECLDSTEGQDYVFTVSVQPHGSYPTEEVYEDPEIVVSGDMDEEKKNQWTYYVNELKEEDEFIADLIAAVEERDEPTVILFYGDHLPTLGLEDDELSSGNTFQTDYVIWDNIGLKENDEDITSYQAFAKLTSDIDIHYGTIFTLHQKNMEEETPSYMTNLQTLQYDLLYGKRYAYFGKKKYKASDSYQLGLYKPTITGITKLAENLYYVTGDNFTQSSRFFADGEQLDCLFVSDKALIVTGGDLTDISRIRIGTQSNSSTHRILNYGPWFYLNSDEEVDSSITVE